jgi:ATP-dependent Lhr-like helicase
MSDRTFHPAVDAWFEITFEAPTPVQVRAWRSIRSGCNTLISAPTGSGKTLAGFLAVIDDLVHQSVERGLPDETQVLYVSPLKALSNDIQKNLEVPLAGIRRELAARMLGDAPIRASVRTGDTPQSERARMRRKPPHILVTTPESLYILLTSDSGRAMLTTVRTVLVDEIHAVAGTKRGAHLALSLERLAALCGRPPVRVGISATTKPIARMAEFLIGRPDADCEIIDEGHVRNRDIALETTASPLEPLMANEVWAEIYDRLAELIRAHRTTLVFVNTRRLAERAARHLAERLGEEAVTSHHGSLAKEHRLNAEERLKSGKLEAIVATASLELGIDIGDIDLVCQLGSPRAIATFLQRVGRSGHGIERMPKGRLFPLSRDEMVECVALVDSVRRGELDAVRLCPPVLDVLAQQIVAETAVQEWGTDALYELVRRTAIYRELDASSFEAVVKMLADGFSTHRGRRSAHVHHDRVNRVVRGRRGAKLTAITNGGAIPDQFDYDVLLMPSETPIGTLNEDFAFESLAGDIFQLGNTSYRILRVHGGKVFVEDARGQPPNIPFWFGEAPGRSDELSTAVSRLRARIDAALEKSDRAAVVNSLISEMQLPVSVATQLIDYLATAKAALGRLPTRDRIVFERFFDEAGDTHLVIHSPLGSRINRAWGLALRKRFCRRFNFELQAAALEDSIVLSLGAVHSFALEEVVAYLRSATVRQVLEQAVLGAPIFPTYWRWNATLALAVRRFRNGRKSPAQFQRTDAEDLLATVFPEQLACAENLPGGDREIPDHPLVRQTLSDCLEVAMDVDGLEALLARIENGDTVVSCRDLSSPSPLAQEVLAARPYAFLDDAPAEERRTLAVQSRRYMSVDEAAELGRLDAAAIDRVRREAWPDARNADELHDALVVLGCVSEEELSRSGWTEEFARLVTDGRAVRLSRPSGLRLCCSTERLAELRLVYPDGRCDPPADALESSIADRESALREIIRGRLEGLGPVTADTLGRPLSLATEEVGAALGALEQQGCVMRGAFTSQTADEWCERRLLARIHRYTLRRLRSEIEPATLAEYQRFLFGWQGFGEERREGREGLSAVLSELQGLCLPAVVWERAVLPARVAAYGGDLLDALSMTGEVVWWRPRPGGAPDSAKPSTVAASPIAIVPRASLAYWRAREAPSDAHPDAACSSQARRVFDALESDGALFFLELVQRSGLLRVQVEEALGELVARGLVTADSFNGLRALIRPQRERGRFRGRRAANAFDTAGRWTLVRAPSVDAGGQGDAIAHAADALLRRYGVVTRAVIERETLAPRWRDLLDYYRRREARGEIRGGRFVDTLSGEQFALTDAVETLRRLRRRAEEDGWTVISAADPVNMMTLGGQTTKVPMIASNRIAYRAGVPVAALTSRGVEFLVDLPNADENHARSVLAPAHEDRRRSLRTRF